MIEAYPARRVEGKREEGSGKSMGKATTVIVALALLTMSCATNRIDTDLRGATVRIEPDSVLLERTPGVTRLTAKVIIRNDRAAPLYLGGCGGPEAQEEIDGQWVTVWSPICMSFGTSTIAPGDSVVFPFNAARVANIAMEPQLDPRATAGRYRLQLGGVYSRPIAHGTVVYRGPAPPPAKLLGMLTSPVFKVYSR